MLNKDKLAFSNSKLIYSFAKIIKIQIKIEVKNSKTKFWNVKGCLQTRCSVRYLLFLTEWRLTVSIHDVYCICLHNIAAP